MKKEGGDVRSVDFAEIGHHFVGNQRLGAWTGCAAGVSDRVKYDLARLLNRLSLGSALTSVDLRQGQNWFDCAVDRHWHGFEVGKFLQ
jgi:hypothetical protein